MDLGDLEIPGRPKPGDKRLMVEITTPEGKKSVPIEIAQLMQNKQIIKLLEELRNGMGMLIGIAMGEIPNVSTDGEESESDSGSSMHSGMSDMPSGVPGPGKGQTSLGEATSDSHSE